MLRLEKRKNYTGESQIIDVATYGCYMEMYFEPFVGCRETLYLAYSRKTFERRICATFEEVAKFLGVNVDELIHAQNLLVLGITEEKYDEEYK